MAIGASVAHPDRQVISLSGDGGLAMLLGELLTVKTHRLPVKVAAEPPQHPAPLKPAHPGHDERRPRATPAAPAESQKVEVKDYPRRYRLTAAPP
jgi:Thiamine pyrophosphate enzyme, C-terminal TPP binding domain